MRTEYRGLTWDHPRGYNALAAAAASIDPARDGFSLIWDKQPLEGFESHPIEDLAKRYDLIVLDHPHIGEAVAGRCLAPLSALFAADDIAAWQSLAAGRSFASYVYAGESWALPLDAATQVMAYRRDLLDADPPSTWQDVIALAARHPVCLSLAGPHAILSFFSIAAALGEPAATRDPERLISRDCGHAALDIMAQLAARNPSQTLALNPIGILDLMSRTSDVALCPLVYGYVNYATALPHAVSFTNTPVVKAGGRHGSTLGGTGIAISRRCEPSPGLLAHLRWLMSSEAQSGFIPQHDGQPGMLAAWQNEAVNHATDRFFHSTLATIEDAWIRPRYDGYIAFQSEASAILRNGLTARTSHDAILEALERSYRESRQPGMEN